MPESGRVESAPFCYFGQRMSAEKSVENIWVKRIGENNEAANKVQNNEQVG